MRTVLDQLRTEYEATLLDGTWEVFEDDDGCADIETGVVIYPVSGRRNEYIEICTTEYWDDADNNAPQNMKWIASAHSRMPLLLAVARAVAELPPGFLYSLAKDMRRRGGQVEMQLADAIEAVAKAIAPLLEEVRG